MQKNKSKVMQNCSSYIRGGGKVTEMFLILEIKEKVETKFNKAIKQLHTVGIFIFLSSHFLEAFIFPY